MSQRLYLHVSTVIQGFLITTKNLILSLKFSGSDQPRTAIYLNSIAVGLERFGKNIIVGCMDSSLHCYTTKVKSKIMKIISKTKYFLS